MKTLISTLLFTMLLAFSLGLQAQDISAKLNEASNAYGSGDLDNARFALEQALSAINQEVGKEILALLPTELAGMPYAQDKDDVTGTNTAIAGLFVNRYYGQAEKNANIEIISDSPLMAGISTILAMPMIMNNANPDQKRIKVNGYKALLQKNTGDAGKASYDVQLPFNKSLLTFHCEGIEDENEVITLANQLPIDQIAKYAQ